MVWVLGFCNPSPNPQPSHLSTVQKLHCTVWVAGCVSALLAALLCPCSPCLGARILFEWVGGWVLVISKAAALSACGGSCSQQIPPLCWWLGVDQQRLQNLAPHWVMQSTDPPFVGVWALVTVKGCCSMRFFPIAPLRFPPMLVAWCGSAEAAESGTPFG